MADDEAFEGKHEHVFEYACIHQGRFIQRTYKRCECGKHQLISTEVFMPLPVFLIFIVAFLGNVGILMFRLVFP